MCVFGVLGVVVPVLISGGNFHPRRKCEVCWLFIKLPFLVHPSSFRSLQILFLTGGDPISGGDIWKRIYQPSYIQEQYVLTHCSVSTDHSQGLLSHSSTSSESTGSRDVPPEGGSLAQTLESSSQQGQKSVSLCNSSTKSAPIPQAQQSAGTKVSHTQFTFLLRMGLFPFLMHDIYSPLPPKKHHRGT